MALKLVRYTSVTQVLQGSRRFPPITALLTNFVDTAGLCSFCVHACVRACVYIFGSLGNENPAARDEFESFLPCRRIRIFRATNRERAARSWPFSGRDAALFRHKGLFYGEIVSRRGFAVSCSGERRGNYSAALRGEFTAPLSPPHERANFVSFYCVTSVTTRSLSLPASLLGGTSRGCVRSHGDI